MVSRPAISTSNTPKASSMICSSRRSRSTRFRSRSGGVIRLRLCSAASRLLHLLILFLEFGRRKGRAVPHNSPSIPHAFRGTGKHFENVYLGCFRGSFGIQLHQGLLLGVSVLAEQMAVRVERLS